VTKKGCFKASYPSSEWQEVPCKVGPLHPMRLARGPRSRIVGGGTDFLAETSNPISSAVGWFPSVSGVTSESSLVCSGGGCGSGTTPNAFTIQLNTNTFKTPLCEGPECRGAQQLLPRIREAPAPDAPSGPYGQAVHFVCLGLAAAAQCKTEWAFLERAKPLATGIDPDPMFVLWLRVASAYLHLYGDQAGLALSDLLQVGSMAHELGGGTLQAYAGVCLTMAFAALGHSARADGASSDVHRLPGFAYFHDWSSVYAAFAKVQAGRASDAVSSLRKWSDHRTPILALYARANLANALVQVGDLEGACREATRVLQEGTRFPHAQLAALAAQASVELLRGRPAEALACSERALSSDAGYWHISTLHQVRAEALQALGKTDDACSAIRVARDRILSIAAPLRIGNYAIRG
jgi:tetratricopeptide (TPR) repeat protein